ncbi:hypothetical protein KBX03_07600 [Micromonospora sp. C72]|uniref:hypothetical protein n=1 Tax=Micromonospora sp. C72 TaxID=2824880 RepID=UPI001B380D7C|nr:hypothetical protein [Micromonospora sp. C72]MBQ1042368.1 hypothetical protein [Micromonospora sp. C72]
MTLTGDRQDIANALSTVTGVTGYAYRPTTPKMGDAWPLLSSLENVGSATFEITWRVLVFLPQNEQASSEWIDSHVDALVDALLPIGYVDRIEPIALSGSAGDQYVLQLTMRGE